MLYKIVMFFLVFNLFAPRSQEIFLRNLLQCNKTNIPFFKRRLSLVQELQETERIFINYFVTCAYIVVQEVSIMTSMQKKYPYLHDVMKNLKARETLYIDSSSPEHSAFKLELDQLKFLSKEFEAMSYNMENTWMHLNALTQVDPDFFNTNFYKSYFIDLVTLYNAQKILNVQGPLKFYNYTLSIQSDFAQKEIFLHQIGGMITSELQRL